MVAIYLAQAGSCEDTIDDLQWHEIMHQLLMFGTPEHDRNAAVCAWCYSAVGRSDDARRMHICDIVKPRILRTVGELGMQYDNVM